MRVIFIGLVAAALSSAAFAQDVSLKLNPQEQTELVAICALAIKSPSVVQPDDVLSISEVCVRWRAAIKESLKHPDPKPEPPKE